jgi:Ca-activated chloride channel family protein
LDFPKRAADQEFVPRLWATRRVGYLLDEIRLRGESGELRDEVTELARKYGIVTPYTAYLIHEDEARRQVPLAVQSVPQLQVNEAARAQAGDAYMMFQKADSGASAVAAARYGQAQKSADRVGDALSMGRMEAGRAMAAAPKPASRGTLAARLPAQSAPGVAGIPFQPAAMAVGGEAGQSRYVGGRTFYQNGNQWIDALVQQSQKLAKVELKFGSDAYFELMAKNPEVKPWLALGQNVQFVLGNRLYVVAE